MNRRAMDSTVSIEQYLSHVQFTPVTRVGLDKYILEGGMNSIREVEYVLPKIMLKIMGGLSSP